MKKLIAFVIPALMVGCSSEKAPAPVDCESTGPSITLEEKSDAQCGQSDGSFSVTVSGGEGDLTYKLDDQTVEAGTFDGLAAGSHTLTVTDQSGCEGELTVTIANLNGVNITSVESTSSGCGSTGGTITVTASGGTPPYQYKIGSGSFQESETFSGLGRGSYSITVSDATECETTTSRDIESGVSFAQQIKPIIDASCAVSGCHNGTQAPDLRVLSNVQAFAPEVKALTGSRTMPAEGTISQSQIDLIACWVDDGAKDN